MNGKSMKARSFGLLRRTRAPVLVLVATLVLLATLVAFAANGKPFVLGKTNVATAVSKLPIVAIAAAAAAGPVTTQ